MAVEAQHINLFPSQFVDNRNHGNYNNMLNNTQMDCNGLGFNNITANMPAATAVAETLQLQPFYNLQNYNKADSGLTCNAIPVTASMRKRPRDHSSINEFSDLIPTQKSKFSDFSSFIDRDTLLHIQLQQQSEIDRLVAEHTQKVRMELEERKRRESAIMATTIRDKVIKKLKEKDEEIQRIGKLNWVLQERVKSLYVENQIWRDLAQTNEATANSLRSNLEQVLAHVSEDNNNNGQVADDVESSCGSSDGAGRGEEEVETVAVVGGGGVRLCKKCGVKESSVLLLPCRHLCLCTFCGSTLLGTCPVCDSVMNGTVHVNMF